MTEKLTADVINNRVSGYVVDPESGDKYEAVFKDPTDEERRKLAELEEQTNDGDQDAAQELQSLVVGEYLIEPDLDPDTIGIAWAQSILVGFLRALGDNKAIEEAQDFFDSVEEAQGNR